MSANTDARPLEVLVAERVLGWEVYYSEMGWGAWRVRRSSASIRDLNSWSGLGLVVEAMEERGMAFFLEYMPDAEDPPWEATFMPSGPGPLGLAEGGTPWSAAFVAALRALGVDEAEIQQAVEGGDDAR